MFKIVENKLSDGSVVFDVTGSIGEQSITLSALNEIHACEIARALNQASAIAIEQPMELAGSAWNYADIRDSAPELNRAEQLAEAQLRG